MDGVARISIDSSDLESLFANIAAGLNFRKNGLGRKIADVLREDALAQFQAGGSPHWAPLSPRTIARKEALGYPRLNRRGLIPRAMIQRGNFGPSNILMMTGDLLQSWTRDTDPHHVEEIDDQMVSIGSDLIYAGTHQNGGEGWKGSEIPARPIRITDSAKAKISELIEQNIGN